MSVPRPAQTTVNFVDHYCADDRDLFNDVRSFEQFKYLHLGMIAELPRKTLPAIARVVGLDNAQPLHHFLAYSPCPASAIRDRRLQLLRQVLQDRPMRLCIDETGDKKKGKTTDYVARQYIGNLGKIENGLVSVNAYGIVDNITVPLVFDIFKPQKRLKPTDGYRTKPHIAIELIEDLTQRGFQFDVVLADSLYGDSSDLIRGLGKQRLRFVVAIRDNHGVLLPPGQRIRYTTWSEFDRVFSNGQSESRYLREIVFGQRRAIRYYHITTDVTAQPSGSTWLIMTNLAGPIKKTVGNTYGMRTWIEYGFKQSKDELGWADFRVTAYAEIEKWWEVVCSAYLMVSLQSPVFKVSLTSLIPPAESVATGADSSWSQETHVPFCQHPWWDQGQGWKNQLNNLRLILQPYICHCLLAPWLMVFTIPELKQGLTHLQDLLQGFQGFIPI